MQKIFDGPEALPGPDDDGWVRRGIEALGDYAHAPGAADSLDSPPKEVVPEVPVRHLGGDAIRAAGVSRENPPEVYRGRALEIEDIGLVVLGLERRGSGPSTTWRMARQYSAIPPVLNRYQGRHWPNMN